MDKISKILTPLYLISVLTGTALADLPPGQPITFNELDYIIARIASFLVTTSGVLAVIYIVWSGITYMNAGSDTTKVGEAQARLKSAVIGTAIVLGVGVIINTVLALVTREFFCQLQVLGICLIP